MPSNGCNDTILDAYLTSENAADSERELEMLLSEYAEPRLRGIILSRLGFQALRNGRQAEYEDLCSEVRTRVVVYLQDLKANLRQSPCEDFRRYVAAVSHNTCHDFYRQRFPARTRLQRRVRDLLHTRRGLAMWRSSPDANADWICGFDFWSGQSVSNRASGRLDYFLENTEKAAGSDFADLIASIFAHATGPVRFSDLVDLVADIKGVKDVPASAIEDDDGTSGASLEDSRIRIDSLLEMREHLGRAWNVILEMPREDARAYLLYARDTSGENLVSMFIAVRAAREEEVAEVLGVSNEGLTDLLLEHLPMENDEIALRLGITLDRLYKLRYRAGKRVKAALAETMQRR